MLRAFAAARIDRSADRHAIARKIERRSCHGESNLSSRRQITLLAASFPVFRISCFYPFLQTFLLRPLSRQTVWSILIWRISPTPDIRPCCKQFSLFSACLRVQVLRIILSSSTIFSENFKRDSRVRMSWTIQGITRRVISYFADEYFRGTSGSLYMLTLTESITLSKALMK